MYGWIHESIKQLVLRKYGVEAWGKIIQTAQMADAVEIDHHYKDDETNRLVNSVSTIVGVPVEEVWEAYGGFLTQFTMETGWDELLRAMGSDLKSFLDNLDALHYFIDHVVYNARLKGPSFRCDQNEDGTLQLHYYSKRNGLYPIVKGVVREIARKIFMIEITMKVVERKMELIDGTAEGGGRLEEHVIFNIVELTAYTLIAEGDMQLELLQFAGIFPYHICFNEELTVLHCGKFIQKVFWNRNMSETKLSDILEIVHPEVPMSFDNFNHFNNSIFVFKLMATHGSFAKGDILRLKGQMVLLDSGKQFIYLCSPYLTTVRELIDQGLHIGDIPLHDTTRDLILLNQSRMSQVETNKKLEEATKEMTKLADALQIEKEKTDELLSQLLPQTISEGLKSGKPIEAGEFKEATVLFSDIVKFTVICSKCTPIEVVDLLNDLYSRFDRLTSLNNVYKVETIGDAYMVVGGVPVTDPDHAELILNQGIGMLFESKQVQAPDGKTIIMRIGVHTGPVTAGVVGRKMPRYCLFGQTVNLAHSLESEGVPGKIQMSDETYKSTISRCSIEVEERGLINISGTTILCHLLVRNNRKSVWDLTNHEKGAYNTIDGYHEIHEAAAAYEASRKEIDRPKKNILPANTAVIHPISQPLPPILPKLRNNQAPAHAPPMLRKDTVDVASGRVCAIS